VTRPGKRRAVNPFGVDKLVPASAAINVVRTLQMQGQRVASPSAGSEYDGAPVVGHIARSSHLLFLPV
jgi:hypothetical protein